MEGFEACFGRCTSVCTQSECRWHRECTALLSREETNQPDALSPAVSLTYRS